MDALEAAYATLADGDLETAEEREARLLEEELEADLARRALAERAPPPRARFQLGRKARDADADAAPSEPAPVPAAGPRFALPRFGRKAPASPEDASLEERKARLLARKAELEARQREKDQRDA